MLGLVVERGKENYWGSNSLKVSNLMNGRYTLFSQERLFGFLNKLDRKVTVKVTPRRRGEKPQEVVFA